MTVAKVLLETDPTNFPSMNSSFRSQDEPATKLVLKSQHWAQVNLLPKVLEISNQSICGH
jgi:hypothetical protein